MDYPNIFTREVTRQLHDRIEQLDPGSQPKWGKMNVAQMLAHCNVSYELAYENIHPKPSAIQKFFVKLFAKNIVVGPKPYKRNLRTAPVFLMTEEKDFQKEKARLQSYLDKTLELGEDYFDMRESHSFGTLTKNEWNTLFYKHLDHHLQQFGV